MRQPRASGRTFRRILTSLVKASGGNRVLYVTASDMSARVLFDKAKDISNLYSSSTLSPEKTIFFEGGGWVKFISQNSLSCKNLRGLGKVTLIYDD